MISPHHFHPTNGVRHADSDEVSGWGHVVSRSGRLRGCNSYKTQAVDYCLFSDMDVGRRISTRYMKGESR